jgi:exodeoxyribonuclease VII small subunit
MNTETIPADIAALSFEEAMAELETIVRDLESGNKKLEESIDAYSRGANLKAHCAAKLRDAQLRVERIARTADGEVTAAPTDID